MLCLHQVNAQNIYSKKNADDRLLNFMKLIQAREVSFFMEEGEAFNWDSLDTTWVIYKDKKSKKWGIKAARSYGEEPYEVILKPAFDSIGYDVKNNWNMVLKDGDKYGVVYARNIKEKSAIQCRYDNVAFIDNGSDRATLVMRNGKWGLYQPELAFLSYPCVEKSKQSVPLYNMSEWEYNNFLKLKDKYQLTGYMPDGNGDGTFYACNATGKWGLFQMDRQIIPVKYDSIMPMSFNAPFVIVYDNGKGGIYCHPFGETKMTVGCKNYDELKRFKSNGFFYCAARKGQKWAVLDWYTGKLLSEFTFESFQTILISREMKSEFYEN